MAVPPGVLEDLYEHLETGGLAILDVDMSTERGLQQHFVLAVGVRRPASGAREIIIHDPYGAPNASTGVLRNLCPRYGPTAARAIWRIIKYRILEGVRLAATLGTFARRMVAPGDRSIPVARQVDPQRLAEDAEPFIAADTDADVGMKFDPVGIRDGEPYMRTVDTGAPVNPVNPVNPVHYGLYISPDAQPNRPQSENYSLYIGTEETVRPARNITTVDTDEDMDVDVDVDGPGLPFDGCEKLAEYARFTVDARATASEFTPPLYAISGVLDPVVPWPFVRPWLMKHCPILSPNALSHGHIDLRTAVSLE